MLFSVNVIHFKTPANTGSLNQLGGGISRFLKATNCVFDFCFHLVHSFYKTLLVALSTVL